MHVPVNIHQVRTGPVGKSAIAPNWNNVFLHFLQISIHKHDETERPRQENFTYDEEL